MLFDKLLSTSNRPLSPRDFFIVQDYVLVKNSEDRPWFFTYNHDVSHVRFPCVCIETRTQRHNDICTDPFAVSLPARCAREGRLHEDERQEAGYGRCPTRRRQGSDLDVALERGFQRHGPSRFVFCPSSQVSSTSPSSFSHPADSLRLFSTRCEFACRNDVCASYVCERHERRTRQGG